MSELLLLLFFILFSFIHLVHFLLNYLGFVDLNGYEAPDLVQTVDLLIQHDIVV